MQALLKVQTELKAPKKQFNSFGKYPYRSCEDILEAVKPLLKELDLLMLISDDVVTVGDRFYVKSTITIYNETDSISAVGFSREEENKKGMDGSQITGASSSYARKYALNGLFLIDDSKESDTTNTEVNTDYVQEIEKFNDVKKLREYYTENKGRYKTEYFDIACSNRAKIIESPDFIPVVQEDEIA